MKHVYLICSILLALWACNDPTIGYLQTEGAGYLPAEMEIRNTLDPEEDAVRIENQAPWVTGKIQGVLGTAPLIYSFESVKASEGGDAEAFSKVINVRGAGMMEIPIDANLPAGRYTVSIRVSNEGYSAVLPDAFTFIVVD